MTMTKADLVELVADRVDPTLYDLPDVDVRHEAPIFKGFET